MAFYDYRCDACGYVFEVQHGMNDPGPKKCPECGKRKIHKVIGKPAYHNHYSPMHPRAHRGRGY
jgi:putative FmdB family regulatory protein